jgi:hypothetical protein
MKYVLLMYANDAERQKNSDQETYQVWNQFNQEAQASGTLLSTNGVAPNTTATTVRVRDGKTLITDGPFAETHEQLAGFLMFECKDLDEALAWAAKIPTAKVGSIEVRPLWSPQ